jgi:hypothetical protein
MGVVPPFRRAKRRRESRDELCDHLFETPLPAAIAR